MLSNSHAGSEDVDGAGVFDVGTGEDVVLGGFIGHSFHWHYFRIETSVGIWSWSAHYIQVFWPAFDEHPSTQGGGGVVGNGPFEPRSVEPISPMAALAKRT